MIPQKFDNLTGTSQPFRCYFIFDHSLANRAHRQRSVLQSTLTAASISAYNAGIGYPSRYSVVDLIDPPSDL
ncbi:hypothetical protein O181_070335 [Austropuccinia psidii MF-1]|uniref:Uncharacterized protein n=1 Tax=Austropuccinia psidii MF-1 TaxID=1389203 RepID=A0A9Q3I8Y6_9BASI|nr:hypothetical protein [Austropuccinia psidii MF-1]